MTGRTTAIERELFIGAPPETVFRFLIDPVLMARWMGISHEIEPYVGGAFRVALSPGNIAVGRYVTVEPPTRLSFTWGWETSSPSLALVPPGSSQVDFVLTRQARGTLLRLRHGKLPQAVAAKHAERWDFYLGRIDAAVRTVAGREASL